MRILKLLFFVACIFFSASVFAAPPTPNPDVRTLPSGRSITINVLANDSDPDGDQLTVIAVTQPSSGVATLNSDGSVFYVADAGTAGQIIRFSYTVEDENTETAQGDIIITLVEPDYSTLAQGINDSNLADALIDMCSGLREQDNTMLGASRTQLLQKCNRLERLSADDPEAFANALTQIAPEEASSQMRVAVDSSRKQTHAVDNRVQQQKVALNGSGIAPANQGSFSLNGRNWIASEGSGGAAGSTGSDLSDFWSRFGLFASVQIGDAQRDRSELENGYDASSSAFTIGGDYFLNKNVLLGSTFSYSQNTVDYSNADGQLDGNVTSLGIFGAYFYRDLSLYMQLSQGWISFDSKRHIRYGSDDFTEDERVSGSTVGQQQAWNTRLDWSWQRAALNITPFMRVDFLNSQIDGYGEQGGGGFAMVLGDQKTDQMSLALGLQSSYAFKPSWGVLMPAFGVTYISETQSSRDPIAARFALDVDQERGYMLENDGGDTDFYELSLGTSAVFKHGFSGFFEYTQILGYDYLTASQLQLGARMEF